MLFSARVIIFHLPLPFDDVIPSGSKRARPGSVKSRFSSTSELFPVEEEEEERSQVSTWVVDFFRWDGCWSGGKCMGVSFALWRCCNFAQFFGIRSSYLVIFLDKLLYQGGKGSTWSYLPVRIEDVENFQTWNAFDTRFRYLYKI